jgi:hypothetical protein
MNSAANRAFWGILCVGLGLPLVFLGLVSLRSLPSAVKEGYHKLWVPGLLLFPILNAVSFCVLGLLVRETMKSTLPRNTVEYFRRVHSLVGAAIGVVGSSVLCLGGASFGEGNLAGALYMLTPFFGIPALFGGYGAGWLLATLTGLAQRNE